MIANLGRLLPILIVTALGWTSAPQWILAAESAIPVVLWEVRGEKVVNAAAGLCVATDGETGYVLAEPGFALKTPPNENPKLSVIFRSGTARETKVPGEIVGNYATSGTPIVRIRAQNLPDVNGRYLPLAPGEPALLVKGYTVATSNEEFKASAVATEVGIGEQVRDRERNVVGHQLTGRLADLPGVGLAYAGPVPIQFVAGMAVRKSDNQALVVAIPTLNELTAPRVASDRPQQPEPVEVAEQERPGLKLTSDATRVMRQEPLMNLPRMPQPTNSNRKLAKPAVDGNGTKIVPLDIDPRSVQTDWTWAPDGKALYAVTTRGTVSRIDASDYTETNQLDIGKPIADTAWTNRGLVVLLAYLGEAWLLDPQTLSVLDRIKIPGAQRIEGSPSADVGYSVGPTFLDVIDWSTATRVHHISNTVWEAVVPAEERRFQPIPSGELVVTPDGKYLVLAKLALVRLKADGHDLFYEESGPRISVSNKDGRLVLSQDGKRIAAYCGSESDQDGWPRIHDGSYVFSTTDLSKPLFALQEDGATIAKAFDSAGNIYASDGTMLLEIGLAMYSPDGRRSKTLGLGDPMSRIFRVLPQPDGTRVIVIGREAVLGMTPD
jgi:hypothetical protein